MQTARRIALITTLLLVLIFAPMLVVGYADLSFAVLVPSAHDKSQLYEAAAQRLPWRADLYEDAGVFASDAQEYSRALTLFQTADQKGVLSSEGRFEVGGAYFFLKDDEKAIAQWTGLLDDEQVRGSASLNLVMLYHRLGRFSDEQAVLQKWLAFDPTNHYAQYAEGLLLFAQASPNAIPLLQSAASTSPSLKPNVDGLVSALNSTLQDPSASGRLVACGRTLAAMSEWPLAQDTFLRATQAAPQDGLAWAWLGEAYQQTGSTDPLPALEKAASLSPNAADVHGLIGLYWQRQRDWHKARVEFDSAAQLDPQSAIWQISLGEVYVQLGDLVKALAYYQAAVDLAPSDVQTWRALALFSVENNVDVDGTGREAALRAYALDPQDPQNMDILGRALSANAQWEAAEAILKKAIAADPQNAAPVLHLGLLYLQTNQPDLARQTLQSAQKLDPDGSIGAQAARVLARYFP